MVGNTTNFFPDSGVIPWGFKVAPDPVLDNNTAKQKSTTKNKIVYVTRAVFWTLAIVFNPVVDFFTQGLSDFLALETLRHGTSYQNYINIRIKGLDPAYSYKGIGASFDNHTHNNEGFVFVSKDSEACGFSADGKIFPEFFNRIVTGRLYCLLSATKTFKNKGIIFLIPRILVVILSVLFVPTIKFRYTLEEINKLNFKNDSENACMEDERKGMAYYTDQKIDTSHIGIRGILVSGFQGDVWARMKAHPVKSTWGLVKLINPIGIVILLGVGVALAVKSSKKGT
jgi:hypothetical protein